MDVVSQYRSDVRAFPDFTREPLLVADLVGKMKSGSLVAKAELVESTLNYILGLAESHCRRENCAPLLLDLVQEGNKRVLTRIEQFDPKRASLKTFIFMCANTAFYEYLSKSGIVISSRYSRRMARYIKREHLQLSQKLGREATDRELSEHLGITESRLIRLKNSSVRGFVDLDASPTEEHETSLSDRLEQPSSGSKNMTDSAEAREYLDFAVECLGKRDADMWKAYKEGNTDHFYDLYFRLKGKGRGAARAFIARRTKKLRAYIQKKTRRSTTGGNHEVSAARSR